MLELQEKLDEQATRQVRNEFYQHSLELHEKLEKRGAGYLDRARVRAALSTYLRHTVAPFARQHGRELGARDYLELSKKLDEARPWAVWGVDPLDDSLVVEWAQRAGLVKLCPDDARDEGMRAAARYGPLLESLQAEGLEVQYAVFTLPNLPRWHLAAGIDAIFDRLRRELLYARTDGRQARNLDDKRRRFPELRGALATLEAPLSRHGDWNVHLNVLLVFAGRPDWRAYREAWGANVEFRTVPTGAGGAALRELVKYPLKAVALKSGEKRAQGSVAPPVIEWPADAFDEWWRAHKGLRRTRSWGVLYSGKVPELPRPPRNWTEWLGKVTLTPTRFVATRPMWDTSELDRRAAARVDLILGNKSANSDAPYGHGPPVKYS